MNHNFFLLAFVLCFLLNLQATAQKSCCNKPDASVTAFASLGADEEFRKTHADPLPFVYSTATGKMITYKTPDGKTAQVFELKAAKPTNRCVFIFHEWWGLNDYIKREAEMLQKELGNVNVYALDLYDGKVADTRDSAAKIMGELSNDRARAIISGLKDHVGAKAEIATIGWCMGGGWSMQAALMLGEQTKVCVLYYGMPETSMEKLKQINFPVLGLFADKDKWIGPDVVKQFEINMTAAGKKEYFNFMSFHADHGFANPSNPNYDTKNAEGAHMKAVLFLKMYLLK